MKNTIGQVQHDIPLRFADDTEGVAVRTGTYAAWLCVCLRRSPLLGYSDDVASERADSIVRCPDCRRTYRVVGPGLKEVPTHVQELSDGYI